MTTNGIRMITALLLLATGRVALVPRAQAQALVQVSDTLYNADGSTASGRIVISWDPFTTGDNATIDGGTLSYTIPASGVDAGTVDVSLAPNAGASPAGTSYRVRYYLANGASYTETWVVPASGPVAIREVRVTVPPTPSITINGSSQLTGVVPLVNGGTNQSAWTAARCVRVNSTGTALEAAGADCGSGGGGSGYGAIQEEGSGLTPRSTLNFIGGAVTASDDAANSRTNVTLSIGDSDIPASITRDSEINVQGTANEITSSGSGVAPTLSIASQLNISGKEIIGGATPLKFEGATDDNTYTTVAVTDPSAARTFTIPNADSVAVQPQTCSGTDKVSAISAAGLLSCSADQTGGGSAHNLLSATHTDTTGGTVARGDLIVGQGTTASWQRLGIGSNNTFLASNGTDASWTAPSGGGSVVGTGRTIGTSGAALSGGGDLSANRTIALSASPDSASVVGTGRTLTGGAGIAAIGDLSADRTLATASGEADFLASGALTCGAATQGKAQVHTTPLQYCDNAGTPALQYAAYGDSTGKANIALDLQALSSVVSNSEVDNDLTLDNITQITTRSHTSLTDIGTNTHATIDSHISATAAHGATGAVVGTTNVQALDSKTISDGLATTTHAAGANFLQTLRHATDCTAITDGLDGELCYEKDSNRVFMCEPTAGGCDTAGEWIDTTPSGGGITTLNTQTGATQTFSDVDDTNVTLAITSATNNHEFALGWTGILGSARGGTGNGFTLFSGPATTEKTFTLPNASATILTTNAAVTVSQGGTGAATLTGLLQGNGTAAFTAITNSSTAGQVLRVTGTDTYGWGALDLADADAITGDIPDGNLSAAVSLLGQSIGSGEVDAGSIDSGELATANETVTKDISILDPTTSLTNKAQIYWPAAVTLGEVECSVDTGTVTIQLDERAVATPNTAGTNSLTSSLVCDTDSQSTASFTDSGIASQVPHNLQITATSGTPTIVRIHVIAAIN
ncbi:MAG: hypothetical protein HY316_02260 [Acidobacteria bacterium]|nr:hypothetical protein [Acidobacteriota bacterium]